MAEKLLKNRLFGIHQLSSFHFSSTSWFGPYNAHLHFASCQYINQINPSKLNNVLIRGLKDRAHLSTFKIFIFEKFSCFIVPVVFLVIVQSSEMISLWFCEKMTFFPNFFSYHIFAIFVGGASLGLPTTCRLIAVSGARLPSVDGLVVRCIKMHHHVKSAITICCNLFKTCLRYIRVYQHTEALLLCFTYKKLRHEGFM